MKKFIVMDIGGTSIKYGLVTSTGDFLETSQEATPIVRNENFILETVQKIIANYVEKNEISGVCLSSAGMINPKSGEVFYSGPTISNFAGTTFKQVIEKKYGLPCEVENDVNCAGLCEVISGSAVSSQTTLCLTIGTGIGGSFLQGKDIYHGISYSACEIGYMHLRNSDFQTLGATSGLVERVAQQKGEASSFWNGEKIFALAKEKDEVCQAEILAMCDVLGEGIANLCYSFNPETVVLGGGIMAQKEYLTPLILKAVEKYLLPVIFKNTKITFASYGNKAGMLGAFYHFKQQQPQLFTKVNKR